jgi:hypothetical protein
VFSGEIMTAIMEAIQKDNLALSMAFAVALADQEAVARGITLADALVSVGEESPPPTRVWRVHYGPRNYVNRRGGDLTVHVDEQACEVRRVIRGQ